MAVEPPSKKQRVAQLNQVDQPLPGQAENANALIEAVKAMLEPEAQRKQAGKGTTSSLTTLLRDLAEQLAVSADVLHASLQRNSLPDVPEYCQMPASIDFARDVIAYGRRLSFTTFAPPGWTQGQPLVHFRPPAPQDQQLHASTLSHFAVEQEAQRAAAAAARARQPAPAAPIQPAPEVKPAAGSALPRPAPAPILPAGYPPASQDGNGMHQVPKMPEGWQPGDPIPMDMSVPAAPARQPEGPGLEGETAFLKQQPSSSEDSEGAPQDDPDGEGQSEGVQRRPFFDPGFIDQIAGASDTSDSDSDSEGMSI